MTHVSKHSNEQLKEKIATVREVVPNKSNDEIVLVLQHFDDDPEKAIQSFTEDGAAEVLNEWSYQRKKGKTNNKKNKKKKSKQPQEKETDTKTNDAVPTAGSGASVSAKQSASTKPVVENSIKQNITNGDSQQSVGEKKPAPVVKSTESKSLSTGSGDGAQRPEALPVEHATSTKDHRKHHHHEGGRHAKRERKISEKSTSSIKGDEKSEKKSGSALDKSAKDLQRTSVSLGHHRNKHSEEMDNAFKKIKDAFIEVHKLLDTREVQLMRDLTSVKKQATSMFDERQAKAVELKRRADQVKFLNDMELLELRADIKHFVSDRKVDEALGRTSRFQADASKLEEQINFFGEVTQITSKYSSRRPSLTSLSSTVSRSTSVNEDLLSPHGRTNVFVDVANGPSSAGKSIPTAVPGVQMTAAEMGELQSKLVESLKAQGLPVPKSPPHRNKGRNAKGPNQVNKFPENKNRKPNYGQDRAQSRQHDQTNDRNKPKDKQQNDKLQDRHQNQKDRRENQKDRHENQKDWHENQKDRHENQKDRHENQKDRHENQKDRHENQKDRINDKPGRQHDKQDQRQTESQTIKTVRRREQYRRRKREREYAEMDDERVTSNDAAEKDSVRSKEYETKSTKPNRSPHTRNDSPEKKQGGQSKKDVTPEKKDTVENNIASKKDKVENVLKNNEDKATEGSQNEAEKQRKNNVESKPLANGTTPVSKEKRVQRSPRRKPRPASVPNGVILNGHAEHEKEDMTNNNKDNACIKSNDSNVKTIEQPLQNGHVNGSVEVDE
ncbi:uncharacterized protein [Antedon mediterranea]